jgi:hypothetical protein
MKPLPLRSSFFRPFVAAVALAIGGAPAAASAGVPPARVDRPIKLRAPKSFAAAVTAVEKATGVKSDAFAAGKPSVPLSKGRSFALDSRTADRLLAGSHAAFRKAGFYLFRYERGFGLPGERDHVALLATADRDAVLRRMGTADGRGATTEAVVGWLKQLEKEAPFELSEIGVDYIAGRFARVPADPHAMARRTIAIAPALLSGGDREVDLLAEEIRANRSLYLIW